MSTEGTHRRPLLKAFAAGSVALGGIAVAARINDPSDPQGKLPTLTLSSDGSTDVAALDVPLGDDLLPRVARGRWRSEQLPTSTHSMVAVTWAAGAVDPSVEIKSRVRGTWGDWTRLAVLHDAPDAESGEGGATVGTDLLWIGASDGIQVRVDGERPPALTLVLLNPGRRSTDLDAKANAARRPPAAAFRSSRVVVPQPAILKRKDWGADERLRESGPRINSVLKQVHVHHTVSTNDYGADDVAGLIRGMYQYHVKNLGWSDIGYNFLVDRFGRMWTGRAGGVNKLVRGAHTLGFNDTSVGVSAIGNFEITQPTAQMTEAIAQLAAWKLARYGVDPIGQTTVTSEGSDKFRRGANATLPTIDGHRDTNDTACPGSFLYSALPNIRRRTGEIVKGAAPAPTEPPTEPPAPTGKTTMELRTVGYTRRAIVKGTVTFPEGTPAKGKVTVKIGSRRKVRKLKNGKFRMAFLGLKPKKYPVKATHRARKMVTVEKAFVTAR